MPERTVYFNYSFMLSLLGSEGLMSGYVSTVWLGIFWFCRALQHQPWLQAIKIETAPKRPKDILLSMYLPRFLTSDLSVGSNVDLHGIHMHDRTE